MNAQEIRGNWGQIRGKVKEKWGQLTDDDLTMVEGNVERLVGRIQQKTGEARSNVEAFLDDLLAGDSMLGRATEAAREYAESAVETAREGYQQVREQAREGYQRAEEMVQRRPAESMAAVFGLGFITGVVVGLLLRSEA